MWQVFCDKEDSGIEKEQQDTLRYPKIIQDGLKEKRKRI